MTQSQYSEITTATVSWGMGSQILRYQSPVSYCEWGTKSVETNGQTNVESLPDIKVTKYMLLCSYYFYVEHVQWNK
jgi:negative regulator of sigma E activity